MRRFGRVVRLVVTAALGLPCGLDDDRREDRGWMSIVSISEKQQPCHFAPVNQVIPAGGQKVSHSL